MSTSSAESVTLKVINESKLLGGSATCIETLQVAVFRLIRLLIVTLFAAMVFKARMRGLNSNEPTVVALKVTRTCRVIANPTLRHEACVLLWLKGG